ncbi:AEC family transporter [Vulcanococcus limneticus]|uniref:AEC family transporter n=1 Tax=Vulcanococcus limneticus TaxID=2170428 RepID=UPI00398BD694
MQAILQIVTAVYVPILAFTLAGYFLSLLLKRRRNQANTIPIEEQIPDVLARFLSLVGIPIAVGNFIRKAELNASVWLSPVVAWVAILLAIFLSVLLLRSSKRHYSAQTKTSFVLLSYIGNTSYMGFPVILLLPQLGPQYFSSAVLYDILGTLLAGYGLGVIIIKSAILRSARSMAVSGEGQSEPFSSPGCDAIQERDVAKQTGPSTVVGPGEPTPWVIAVESLIKNPIFYAFFIGLFLKQIPISDGIATILNGIAWGSIMVALLVMGMRAQQLQTGGDLRLALQPVAIKTILVPLIMGAALTAVGFHGPQRLVLVLQASMPCAFASLLLAEKYDLDLKLTVASILLSCLVFAFTMPIWVLMFTSW